MAKRVTLHKDFKLTAKKIEQAFEKRAVSNLKSLIRYILQSLEDNATVFGSARPYATGNYASSFRFSLGSVGKNRDLSFFGGSGYGLDGISRLNLGKMQQSRFISFYNIASKETSDGELFHYAGLVDKYGWRSWSFDSDGSPRLKITEPWRIMDKTFAVVMSDPIYGPLLSDNRETIPEGWE